MPLSELVYAAVVWVSDLLWCVVIEQERKREILRPYKAGVSFSAVIGSIWLATVLAVKN